MRRMRKTSGRRRANGIGQREEDEEYENERAEEKWSVSVYGCAPECEYRSVSVLFVNGSVCVDAHPATMPRRMILIRERMGRGARRGTDDEEK